MALSTAAVDAHAELFFIPPLPPDGSLRITFEILPADPKQPLPDEVREIEGGRLIAEQATSNGRLYRKETLVLPLPNGDTRERVIFFAEEDDRLRMLGFHRIRRRFDSPQGDTVVFDSGKPNPLNGRASVVPLDTYSLLGLCTALAGLPEKSGSFQINVWTGDHQVTPAEVSLDGREPLAVLGTRLASRRIRVKPQGGAWSAVYWFTDAAPYSFLQYRGPGDFLLEAVADRAPMVLLRATSSSEQVRKVFPQ